MYCRHDASRSADHDERSASSLFALFIKQLVWKVRQLPHIVRDFGRQYMSDARNPSLEKYVNILRDISQDFDRIFLIIDSLDECEENERQSVIRSCQDLLSVLPSYRVFITSRREDDIEREFLRQKLPMIQIEARNTKADIKAFVEKEVSKLITSNELRLQNQDLKQRIISTLVDESDGMYV